ncbi:MAG: GNAT family N-acetyltransferase [Bacteroidetes bacterium]|nr:GNAT family N-acetyltransferase [Bacteroidota bacterium]
MPLKIIDHGSKEYEQMIALRMDILRRPLGLSFTPEDLEKEKNDILIGAFDDDDLVACCLLTRLSTTTCKLRQMAVTQQMQRNGLGAAMMYYAERVAKGAGFSSIVMNARKTAVGFYEKLGYKVEGEEFTEVTLPHFLMQKQIF